MKTNGMAAYLLGALTVAVAILWFASDFMSVGFGERSGPVLAETFRYLVVTLIGYAVGKTEGAARDDR